MRTSVSSFHRNFALITGAVAILIFYGSLYPFEFHSVSFPESFRTLLATWSTPTGRGDFLANLLLYFPLGLFLFPVLHRLPVVTRFAIVTGAGLALSATVEVLQLFDQGRQSAMGDVYANTAGSILGAMAGWVLFSSQRRSAPVTLERRPFVILLLCSWLGYRLAPFVPVIDLHKYWDALKPLVFSPTLPLLNLYEHTVIVLAIAVMLEALFGVTKSRLGTFFLVLGTILARVLITGTVLSPAEVAGGVLGAVVWVALLSRLGYRAHIVTALFTTLVIIQALEPFQFNPIARPFGWLPFQGFLHGSVEVNVRSFFEKALTYGALVWLAIRAGASFAMSTGTTAGLVLGLRLIQTFVPGRSAEITDVVLLLILAAVLKLMGEDPARDAASEDGTGWFDTLFYQSLTQTDLPEPADLIFVMAGRLERKRYGIELFRDGLAPRLLLSVGRFEVSKMDVLDMPGIAGLTVLRDQTPPDERNFFVELDASRVRFEKSRLPRPSTYGEVLALQAFLAERQVRRVMVISTDVHLRRVALAFDQVFRGAPIQFLYCPVPARFGFLERGGWWRRAKDRRFVLKEFFKLLGYRAIMVTPTWAIRRLMRVN